MLQNALGWIQSLDFYLPKPGMLFVYVAWFEDVFPEYPHYRFKIGLSKNPKYRLTPMNPKVKMIFAKVFDEQYARFMERALHRWFEKKRVENPPGCTGKNEWYGLTPEDLGLIQYGLIGVSDPDSKFQYPRRLERIW